MIQDREYCSWTSRSQSFVVSPLLPPGDVAGSLLPAAELAADKINARDNLLPGYRLELIPADTETCNETRIIESYRSFVKYTASASNQPFNVVGVTGMICATVTQAISPLAGRPDIELLQISAGTSPPSFADTGTYPRLYRVISSSAVQTDALLALMEAFQWRRIGIVSDYTLIDYIGSADNIITKVSQNPNLELTDSELISSPRSVVPALSNAISNAAKIMYVSAPAEEACKLLCAAYKQGRIWPTYVWIFRSLRVEDFRTFVCNNDSTAIMKAVDNVFFINYKFETSLQDEPLVSGDTYQDYRQEYHRRLGSKSVAGYLHANALHDSVWAFALALNSSLDTLTSQDLVNYQLGKSNVTSIIESNIRDLNFSGTLGQIYFTDKREAETMVDILQVKNGSAVQIGYYNPQSQNLALQLQLLPKTIPKDDFERVRRRTNPAAPIVTLTVTAMLIVATTVVLFLFLYHWNKPAIKATSPFLGLVLLFGCYVLYMAVLLVAIREYNNSFGQLCQAIFWFGYIGIELVYATLFARLLRIYRLFFHIFEKPGLRWSDWSMTILILLIVSLPFLLLLLWSTVDPVITTKVLSFDTSTIPPFYSLTPFCGSRFFWVWISLIYYVYVSFTILAVCILAVMTRNIKRESFKDTKKINAFVFISILALIICDTYSSTLAGAGLEQLELAYTFDFLPYMVIAVFCKVFLFLPKIWSARVEKPKYSNKKKHTTKNHRNHSASSTLTIETSITA